MMTSTPPTSHMSRAEVNRRMVAGELTPAAARDATIDLYRTDPAAATHLAAPDQESGEPWDATAPALSPKVERPPRAPGAGRRAAVVTSADPDQAVVSDEPAPAPTTLGAYLAAAREERGLTRTQLGNALGIQSGVVKAYEEDARRPSSFMAPRLAEALGVEPDFLRALVEAQGHPRATSRRGTRRTAASKAKATGKTRGKATSPRTTATRKGVRTVPDHTAPATVKGQGMTEVAMPDTAKIPYLGESREHAAEMVGVSPRYVSDAKRVKKEAPEAFEGLRAVAVPPVLPRLAWQDARYRIVQLRESGTPPSSSDDDEDGLGPRPYVIEREDGRDALGATRWQQIGAGDEGAWMRATHHLMRVLAEGRHGATGWAGEVGHE